MRVVFSKEKQRFVACQRGAALYAIEIFDRVVKKVVAFGVCLELRHRIVVIQK
jgi:hypothetical protein